MTDYQKAYLKRLNGLLDEINKNPIKAIEWEGED